MWLSKWFKNIFDIPEERPVGFTGALLDTRGDEEKKTDIHFDEMVAGASAVNWTVKKWSDFRRFPVQDQSSSMSCVWQTIRKLMRVMFKVNRGLDLDFSASYGYRKRSNYPQGGTMASDAYKTAEQGVTLNALMPSDNLSEVEMNNVEIESYHDVVAEGFKLPYHIELPAGDVETIASVIQTTKKAVMLWFYFSGTEWSVDVPTINDPSNTPYTQNITRHSVAGVDFGIFNGEKGIFIEDSAHFGGKWERFVPESFFKIRNFYASYPINFSFEPGGNVDPNAVKSKPSYTGSVTSLQDCLKYEGVFPTNIQSTGVYGAITTKAVEDFQKKYLLESVGTVGPKTTAVLKNLYP